MRIHIWSLETEGEPKTVIQAVQLFFCDFADLLLRIFVFFDFFKRSVVEIDKVVELGKQRNASRTIKQSASTKHQSCSVSAVFFVIVF